MHHVLITGGTGTIGRAFIRQYYDRFKFHVTGHSELRVRSFLEEFPDIPVHLCSVQDKAQVSEVVRKSNPDIVIHAAAVKHVDLCELNPNLAISTNVLGSLNVQDACIKFGVPTLVGISTDKACNPVSLYGYTKLLMERSFLSANHAICRFGNVAGSAGSVIPIWRSLLDQGKKITVTHPEMRRFMFTKEEACNLIYSACSISGACILTKPMKSVNLLDLARVMAKQGDICIGTPGPGEQLGETLFSQEEATRSYYAGGHTEIGRKVTDIKRVAYTTDSAPKMSRKEIEELLSLT